MKKQSLSTIEFNFVFVCGLSVCNSGTVSFHWGGGEHFVPSLAQSSGVVRGVGLRFWNGGEGVSTSLNEVFQSRKNLNSSLKQLAGARAAECWE